MGETGKKICLASQQNQSANVWKGLLSKAVGDAEGSSSNPNLDLELGISNIYSAEARVANPGSSVNVNTNQTYEGQASEPGLDLKLATEMHDPKRLNRQEQVLRMEKTGKKICLASQQNQSANVWKGLLSKAFGDAEGSSSNPNLDLKLGISNIYSAEARVANPGSSVNVNTNQTYEGQASEPGLDLKLATEMNDPKRLKRMMSNRKSAKNYRLRKTIHTNNMEKKTTALQLQIANMSLKINETKNNQRSLLLEQHQLKLRIAASEKKRILEEVEIKKNMAEVNRLRELEMNQMQGKQNAMRNSDDGLPAVNAQLDLNL